MCVAYKLPVPAPGKEGQGHQDSNQYFGAKLQRTPLFFFRAIESVNVINATYNDAQSGQACTSGASSLFLKQSPSLFFFFFFFTTNLQVFALYQCHAHHLSLKEALHPVIHTPIAFPHRSRSLSTLVFFLPCLAN